MSASAVRSNMHNMVKENPSAIFNVRKIADGTGSTVDSVSHTVSEWIENGWANIHPDTDAELYEFVLTPAGIEALF